MTSTALNLLSSGLASTLRLWNGTWGILPSQVPTLELHLYDQEDDAQCRLVREVLTELNFDVIIYPCPPGGKRFAKQRKKLAPTAGPGPVLHDPNNKTTVWSARRIIAYLFEQYALAPVPRRLRLPVVDTLTSNLASLSRSTFNHGVQASHAPKQLLTLYSFESSPFARLVREQLCSMELPYHLINLGKSQWADMGPATFRLVPGEYHPPPDSKRALFLQQHGKVQVPLLIDPNTRISLFESQDILKYLHKTYAEAK
jgi:glutathione S-transferase